MSFRSEQQAILYGGKSTIAESYVEKAMIKLNTENYYNLEERKKMITALFNSGYAIQFDTEEDESETSEQVIDKSICEKGWNSYICVTTEYVPHYRVEDVIGFALGHVVKTRSSFTDSTTGLLASFGGNITNYESLVSDARKEALTKMILQAKEMKADGIIGLRFDSNVLPNFTFEVTAYGTAVSLEFVG